MKVKNNRKLTPAALRRAFEQTTKLKTLLAIAMHDLRVAEKTCGVHIDMGIWYEREGGTCTVCMAGSVLRHRYKDMLKGISECSPSCCTPNYKVAQRMSAINSLRTGSVSGALYYMGVDDKQGTSLDREVAGYRFDRKGFWRDMRQLLKDLRQADI